MRRSPGRAPKKDPPGGSSRRETPGGGAGAADRIRGGRVPPGPERGGPIRTTRGVRDAEIKPMAVRAAGGLE